jgi:hypothetical protein
MGTPGGGRAHLHRLSVQEGEGVGTDFDGPEGSRRSTTFGPANVNLGRRLILGRSEEYMAPSANDTTSLLQRPC